MKPRPFFGILGALLLAAPLACDQVDLGGANELFSLAQRPAGARALALGSAFEALADDASGVLWNPAAPAFNPGLGLSMHHETWLANTDREILSAQLPLRSWLGLGLYGSLVNYPGSELRDDAGASLGYFTPQEQSLGGALAFRLGQASLGVSGRFLRLALPGEETVSAAGDLGLLWQASQAVRLAAVVKALPKEGGLWQASGSGGLSLRGGSDWRWALSSSVRLDPEALSEWDAGAELGFGRDVPLALRAGYSQSFPAWSADLAGRFSVGLGAGFGHYQMDYAFLPWGSFGATHRLSLSYALPYQPEAAPSPAPTPQPTPQPTVQAAPTPQAQPQPQPAPAPLAVPAPAPLPAPAPQTRFHVLSDAVVQARGLEAAGQPAEALKLYHHAATLDPDDLAAWKGMAGLYQRGGQFAYARQCWQQVLRLDPADPDALAGLRTP